MKGKLFNYFILILIIKIRNYFQSNYQIICKEKKFLPNLMMVDVVFISFSSRGPHFNCHY